jgi:hypothetical protein
MKKAAMQIHMDWVTLEEKAAIAQSQKLMIFLSDGCAKGFLFAGGIEKNAQKIRQNGMYFTFFFI